jgi:TetR/AcrR family transcriptional repressor of nem operon
MARHKEFDVEAALDKAMTLFWQQGYERTSLHDLLKHMAIGRASFYNAFGDKHALFMRVLLRYQQRYNDVFIIDTLENANSGLEGIQAVFQRVIEVHSSDEAQKGCLLVNSLVEIAPNDDSVADYLREVNLRGEDAFYAALCDAQLAHDISSEIDCRAMARFLMATIRGMRVTGRSTHDKQVFEDIARIALAALNE